jgi:general stress protein 26
VVEQDRKELRRLWKHVNDAGFEGPNDPSVALVTVKATFCRVLAQSAA